MEISFTPTPSPHQRPRATNNIVVFDLLYAILMNAFIVGPKLDLQNLLEGKNIHNHDF